MKMKNLMKVVNAAAYELVLWLRSANLPCLVQHHFLVLINVTDEHQKRLKSSVSYLADFIVWFCSILSVLGCLRYSAANFLQW